MGNGKEIPPPDDPADDPETTARRPDSGDDPWLAESYPLVDADFVGATLDRVLHDRSEIESEAACVDGSRFEPDMFDRYAIPPPSPGFVDATLNRVLREREAGLRYGTDAEYEFHRLLENAQVPEPGPDFVESTLRMVLAERHTAQPQLRVVKRPYSLAAAVAALAMCAVLIFWRRGPEGHATDVPVGIAAPVSWAALVTATDATDELALPVATEHPLLGFARRARGGSR